MKRTVSAESAKLIVLLVNELCVDYKKACVNFILYLKQVYEALVISGGGSKGAFAGGVTISLEKKNKYDILLVLQLEVYLFRISP
jgi:predicted acylesterase/phospholipase RssA